MLENWDWSVSYLRDVRSASMVRSSAVCWTWVIWVESDSLVEDRD